MIITRRNVIDALAEGQGVLGKAHDNEPVFILRARDPSARTVVQYWISRAKMLGTDPAKLAEAKAIEDAIEEWNARYGSRVPD